MPIICFWGFLSLAVALYGTWLGYGGHRFAATLTTFILLPLGMLLFAARDVAETCADRLGPVPGILLGASLFLAYLIFSASF